VQWYTPVVLATQEVGGLLELRTGDQPGPKSKTLFWKGREGQGRGAREKEKTKS
jgi:hypothetical protein